MDYSDLLKVAQKYYNLTKRAMTEEEMVDEWRKWKTEEERKLAEKLKAKEDRILAEKIKAENESPEEAQFRKFIEDRAGGWPNGGIQKGGMRLLWFKDSVDSWSVGFENTYEDEEGLHISHAAIPRINKKFESMPHLDMFECRNQQANTSTMPYQELKDVVKWFIDKDQI